MSRAAHPPFPSRCCGSGCADSARVVRVALLIFLMQIAVSAIVHDNEKVKTMLAFIDMLPSIVKSALGGEMVRMGNTAGLIAIGYNHPFVLFLFMLYAWERPRACSQAKCSAGPWN